MKPPLVQLVLSMWLLVESQPPSSLQPLCMCCDEIPWSLLQGINTEFLQSLLIEQVLIIFMAVLLMLSSLSVPFLELWRAQLDTGVLQVWPDKLFGSLGWSHLSSLLVVPLWVQPSI